MDAHERLGRAARSLRDAANTSLKQGMNNAAVIFFYGNNDATKVVDDWLSQRTNIDSLPFTIDPTSLEDLNRRFSPVVFPHRYTTIMSRCTRRGKCIVLIALEDLSVENGLMQWENGPTTVPKGGWTYFHGDQEWRLGENGGGLAIWLELKISQT